jgi:hypothetical protein
MLYVWFAGIIEKSAGMDIHVKPGNRWPEEFRKQGACRFGRSATVRGDITGEEAG